MEKDFIKINNHKKFLTLSNQKKSNGWLLEILSDRDKFSDKMRGQIYLTTINPGVKKGFHIHAVAAYYVTCIKGKVKSIIYKNRFAKQSIISGEGDFKTYELLPGMAHAMLNIGKEQAFMLCYRFPSWSKDIKEQLDVSPDEIETKETWQKISKFNKKFQNK